MRKRSFVAVLILSAAYLLPLNARARSGLENARVVMFVVGESIVLAGGALAGSMNVRGIIKHERPRYAWRLMGWLSAGVNLLVGAIMTAMSSGDRMVLGLGISHLSVGALDLGFTIWSSTLPDGKPARLAFMPWVMADGRGGLGFAAGLRFRGF